MARETTNAGKIGKLQRFSAVLAANSADLPHLEGSRTQFDTLLTRVQEVAKQQAAFIAGKQESSKLLKELLTETERLGNVLRLAVMHHYGIRAEKLAEFGLQPFRGRNRSVKAAPAAKTPPPSPTPPSDPIE